MSCGQVARYSCGNSHPHDPARPGTTLQHSIPDFHRRAYGPQRVTAVVATLAEDGIGARAALHGSGLSQALLRAPATRVSYEQQITVFRNALRLAPDGAVALRAGSRMHVTAYGMWGYALLSSRSLADILDLSIKYRAVIGPLAAMNYETQDGIGMARFNPLIASDPKDDLYRFALEFTVAAHLTLGRDLYGEAFGPAAASVAYAAPAYASACHKAFGCTVRFGHDHNELRFDERWFDRTPRMHDTATHEMARQACMQFLRTLGPATGLSATVERLLIERMPERTSTIETMAQALSIHPRTLRRRLLREGTSFRDILARVREQLAIGYLRQTQLSNDEIAVRLGYSEAANFRHAFARWTGTSPGNYRASETPAAPGDANTPQ